MTTLLHLDASPRRARSLSRGLSGRFVDAWRSRRPDDAILRRDLATLPPPHVDEGWIAAAFTPPERRDAAMREALAWSEAAIDEIEAADVIVIGTPMHNYGLPSALKAWFDQAIRIGRSFSFDLARGDWPIAPALSGKRLVLLSARGEFGFAPGSMRAGLNHLDPHVATLAPYIGVAPEAIHAVAIEYQEFGDARHDASRDAAAAEVERLAERLATIA